MPSEEYLKRKSAYIKRYQKEHYMNISFKIRSDRDKDIIELLKGVPNKSSFIIDLIRKHGKDTVR